MSTSENSDLDQPWTTTNRIIVVCRTREWKARLGLRQDHRSNAGDAPVKAQQRVSPAPIAIEA